MLTLDALEALDAIDRTGSFAAAAHALHKVQSAVSYNIRSLEEALGLPLFDRSGHRAQLTPAGRAVLDEARGLLARVRRLEHIAARFREGFEPTLQVVIDGILPMQPLTALLRALADEGVPTRVQLKVEFLGGVQDRFEAEGADLMLVKEFTPSPHLESRPLPPVECVLVAAPDHPLAQAPTVDQAALCEHVELSVHDSSRSSRPTNPHRLGSPRIFYLSDFHTKSNALLEGLGFGWLPMYLAQPALEAGRLVELPYPPGSRFRFTPSLVWPSDRPPGRTGRRFLTLCGDRLEK